MSAQLCGGLVWDEVLTMGDLENLRNWLMMQGLTVSEFATEMGFSCNYIYMILAGNRRITDSFRWKFATRFGMNEAIKVFGNCVREDRPVSA